MKYRIENNELIIIDDNQEHRIEIYCNDFWTDLETSKGLMDIHYDNENDEKLVIVAYEAEVVNGFLKTNTIDNFTILTEQ